MQAHGGDGNDTFNVLATATTGVDPGADSRFRADLRGGKGIDNFTFKYHGILDGELRLRSDGDDDGYTLVNDITAAPGPPGDCSP